MRHTQQRVERVAFSSHRQVGFILPLLLKQSTQSIFVALERARVTK